MSEHNDTHDDDTQPRSEGATPPTYDMAGSPLRPLDPTTVGTTQPTCGSDTNSTTSGSPVSRNTSVDSASSAYEGGGNEHDRPLSDGATRVLNTGGVVVSEGTCTPIMPIAPTENITLDSASSESGGDDVPERPLLGAVTLHTTLIGEGELVIQSAASRSPSLTYSQDSVSPEYEREGDNYRRPLEDSVGGSEPPQQRVTTTPLVSGLTDVCQGSSQEATASYAQEGDEIVVRPLPPTDGGCPTLSCPEGSDTSSSAFGTSGSVSSEYEGGRANAYRPLSDDAVMQERTTSQSLPCTPRVLTRAADSASSEYESVPEWEGGSDNVRPLKDTGITGDGRSVLPDMGAPDSHSTPADSASSEYGGGMVDMIPFAGLGSTGSWTNPSETGAHPYSAMYPQGSASYDTEGEGNLVFRPLGQPVMVQPAGAYHGPGTGRIDRILPASSRASEYCEHVGGGNYLRPFEAASSVC